MSPQWIPQNIQKRLLLYVLQQLSLFSEIDLPNLEEVSLNNIVLRDVMIDPEKVGKIPGYNLRFGKIGCLELNGGMMGGVNIDASDIDIVIASDVGISSDISKSVQFSLAQSTAELVNTMIIDKDNEVHSNDKETDQEKMADSKSSDNNSESSESSRNFVLSGVMAKAVEMALSKLHVKLKNINIKILSEFIDVKLQIEEASLVTNNGRKNIFLSDIKVISLNDDINRGKGKNSDTEGKSETSDTEDSGDSYEETNSPVDDSLIKSMVFTHEEASSIYMSATSTSFNKPAKGNAFDGDDNRNPCVVLFHIDSIRLGFEGIGSIYNLEVDVDSIKVSLVPLLPSVILVLDGIHRGIKMKNHQLRKYNAYRKADNGLKFPQYLDDDNIEDNESNIEEDTSINGLLNKLHIKKIVLSATSALELDGEFSSEQDDILVSLGNINIRRKNNTLTYGGVESISIDNIKEGHKRSIFKFRNNSNHKSKPSNDSVSLETDYGRNAEHFNAEETNESKIPDKADFRFEVNENEENSKEITALFSKPADIELDAFSMSHLLHIGKSLTSVLESYGQIKGSAEYSVGTAVKKEERNSTTKNSFVLQTASITLSLSFSEDSSLKSVVFPISYNSRKDKMLISKIILSVLRDSNERNLGKIDTIQLSTDSRNFCAFINRSPLTSKQTTNETPREIMIKTSLSLIVPKISLSFDRSKFEVLLNDMKAFISDITNIWPSINIAESCVNAIKNKDVGESKEERGMQQPNVQNRRRITRLGNSLNNYGLSNSAKANTASFNITLENIDIKITNVLPNFGDMKVSTNDISIYQSNNTLHGSVKKLDIFRISDSCEELVSDFRNRSAGECQNPSIIAVLKSGERGKILDVVLKDFLIEYHTNWLNYFGNGANENEDAIPKHNDIKRAEKDGTAASTKDKFDIHFTLKDCVVGFNPGRLQSKLLLIIERGTSDVTFELNNFYVKSSFREISILLIDDVKFLKKTPKDKGKKNAQLKYLSPLAFFTSIGYIGVGSINCTHIGITVNTQVDEIRARNARLGIKDSLSLVDIKVNSDEHQIDLCSDSAHTLIQLINDLKLPITLRDEEKFKLKVDDYLDLLKDIVDNEFSQAESALVGSDIPRDHLSVDKDNGQFEFVDEYYDQVSSTAQSIQNLQINDFQNFNTNSDEYNLSIDLQENHFNEQNIDISAVKLQPVELNINLSKVKLYLYDGYEWKETRRAIKGAVKRVEMEGEREFIKKVESNGADISNKVRFDDSTKEVNETDQATHEKNSTSITTPSRVSEHESDESSSDDENSEALIGETLFKSIHVTLPKGSDPTDLANNINKTVQNETIKSRNGSTPNVNNLKLRKSKSHKVLVDVKNIEVNISVLSTRDPRKTPFVDGGEYEIMNMIELRLDTLNAYDNVPTSTWNKLLSYMNILGDREIGTSMLKLSITNVRPDPNLVSSEAMIHISILPLRLYVDQDTSDFLTRFFSFKDVRFELPPDEAMYIQKLKIDSIRLKLDYKPKKIDYIGIKSGNTSELMNLFILDGSDLTLSAVKIHGIPGFTKLGDILRKAWVPEIQKTQLAGILSGLSPIRSIVNIGGGVKDLVAVPVKEYKKDGRFFRSLQRGTVSFGKTTGYEILNLGAKIASGTQVLLEQGEELLGGEGSAARMTTGSGGSSKKADDHKSNKNDERKKQEGMSSAFVQSSNGRNTKRNLMESSQLLNRNFKDEKDQYGSDKLYSFVEMDETNDIDPKFLNRSILLLDSHEDNSGGNVMMYNNGMDDSSDSEHDPEDKSEKLISLYANQPESVNEGLKDAYKAFGKNLKSTQRVLQNLKTEVNGTENYQQSLLSILKSTPIILIRPVIGTTEALSKTFLGLSNEIDPSRVVESKEKYKFEKKK